MLALPWHVVALTPLKDVHVQVDQPGDERAAWRFDDFGCAWFGRRPRPDRPDGPDMVILYNHFQTSLRFAPRAVDQRSGAE